MRSQLLLCLCLIALVECGSPPQGPSPYDDAGVVDSGAPTDDGGEDVPDGGDDLDGGNDLDGGETLDGGFDGGPRSDAGTLADGGTLRDGGPLPDAGPHDAGAGRCSQYDPATKNLLWGDIHVHTSFSWDAFGFGTPAGPQAAYAFAQGKQIPLAPVNGQPRTAKISRPLDFAAVTDHAERLDHSTYGGGSASTAWSRTQNAAQAANDTTPGCVFSSIYGFEWTGNVSGNWYHRNVVFRTDSVTALPVDAITHPTPDMLWGTLDTTCTRAGVGCDVLTIPHNSNYSANGIIFAIPNTITPAQAQRRARFERVAEVIQHKGNSECQIGVGGTIDPECDFEQMFRTNCVANPTNALCTYGSYVRGALRRGLAVEQMIGVNPLKLGLIASTDTHNATPGNVDEYQYQGHGGTPDGDRAARLDATQGKIRQNAGGLVAVWADENRREAIFDALKRREAYASSGPRIPLRFFGGWSLPANLCSQANLVAQGYATGVPMGGTLRVRPAGAGAPVFVISALKDPGPLGHPNVDLQYAQVVKAWYNPVNQSTYERVFDVAGNKANGASVDTDSCAPSGAGQTSLCTVWTDPTFNPAHPAVYYVRLFQNPTCTSRGFDCAAYPPNARPASCALATTRLTESERVWSSPIWYQP